MSRLDDAIGEVLSAAPEAPELSTLRRRLRRRRARLAAPVVIAAVVVAGTVGVIVTRSGPNRDAITTGPSTSVPAVATTSVAPGVPTGPTGPVAARAGCTAADLERHAVKMPTPRVVDRHIVFDHGQDILDPPSSTATAISAARAWQIAQKFGLLAPPVHGSYEILLANLTSISGLIRRPVWLIVGRDVPTFSLGGPASPPGVKRPPTPPCYFANVMQPIDATTGQSLFYESGFPDAP